MPSRAVGFSVMWESLDECLTLERSGLAAWVGWKLIKTICRANVAWGGPEPTMRDGFHS